LVSDLSLDQLAEKPEHEDGSFAGWQLGQQWAQRLAVLASRATTAPCNRDR
jgi:hypothetical protein